MTVPCKLPWIEPIDAAAHWQAPFLDGLGAHPEARYAYMGLHPSKELIVKDGCVNGEPCDVLAVLEAAFSPTKEADEAWTGGWMGYFAYEFVKYIEPTLTPNASSLPDAVWQYFETGIVFDRKEKTVISYGNRAEEVAKHWEASPPSKPLPDAVWTPRTSQEDYEASVARVKDWIAGGDLFQTNIATRFDTKPLDPLAVYRAMQERNPSPYMCYLPYQDHVIVSNSPEQLFAMEDGTIRTRPIAGTRPRRENPAEDAAMAEVLGSDEKEQAEHRMLVDLLRNDVSKVSLPGTTTVPEWMSIERYSHVMHLVSRVEGTLRPGASVMDCVRAIFPGGTITGAPKHRACMRIHDIEPVARGPYTGSAGIINHAGEGHFNIMIRTLVQTKDRASVHAGAGIVMDSDPKREWQESLQKASAFLNRPGGVTTRIGEVTKMRSWTPPKATKQHKARVLLVDNYDSFVENLRDYCEMLGAETRVIRNDAPWEAHASWATHIILSPGPGHPEDSGATLALAASDLEKPMLGVCLGHQALALAAGGTIRVVPAVHGKSDQVETSGTLFAGDHAQIARYHSLVADLPEGWTQTATLADETLMAMEKDKRFGLQFHPESLGTEDGLAMLSRFLDV